MDHKCQMVGWQVWILKKSRILKAVDGDNKLADKITKALERDKVERVLSKVDSSGKVKTFKIDAKGNIVGEWP